MVGAESLEGWRLPVTEWDSVKDTRKKFEPFGERVIIAGITNPFKIAWHINSGIEILNPIESNCMSPSEIKKRHGDKLVFHGAISVQKTIPNGTVQDVKNEVYERIRTVGYNGGYMVSNENSFPYDAPLENILAMYEAVQDFNYDSLRRYYSAKHIWTSRAGSPFYCCLSGAVMSRSAESS